MTALFEKRVLMELHDVHPGMPVSLLKIFATFEGVDESDWALLIVPDWYGTQRLSDHPDVCYRLKFSPAAKVLHGWSHLKGPSLLHRLLYGTEDRSEFASLSVEESRKRIEQGCRMFSNVLDFEPEWFCAPRWSLGRKAARGLGVAGLPGKMALHHLVWRDQKLPAPSINFDVGARHALRIRNLNSLQKKLPQLKATGGVLRFVVHPVDLLHPETKRGMLQIFQELKTDGWTTITLGEITQALERTPRKGFAAAADGPLERG